MTSWRLCRRCLGSCSYDLRHTFATRLGAAAAAAGVASDYGPHSDFHDHAVRPHPSAGDGGGDAGVRRGGDAGGIDVHGGTRGVNSPWMNRLYYGDNLRVLRESIADESVDLIYLDPPFNSQANYNVLFKSTAGEQSKAQIEAFDDTWHWGDEAELAFDGVMTGPNTDASEMLRSIRDFLKENAMMAYLSMMAVRLLELNRVLKPTGSLYLHCDPTASHYLKLLMDAIFGVENFRNEIIWRRADPKGHAFTRFPSTHDIILYYGGGGRAYVEPAVSRI